MKKNVMMRVASALLVAVLMTTCAISGTFAKYTTNATGSDTARVAKFGVTITANGETFATSEEGLVNGVTANTVLSADTDNVVAPGMSGSMAKMTLTGTPEVAVKVTYQATLTLSDNWLVDSVYYCPIIIKVNGTSFKGATYASAAEFKAAVEGAINAFTKEYAAGTDLSTVSAESLEVTWEWAYFVDEATDLKDTKLGNQAAAGNAATIELTVKTIVTQIN